MCLQARLRDNHEELLRKKLNQQQNDGSSKDDKGVEPEAGPSIEEEKAGPSGTGGARKGEEADTLIDEHDLLKHAYEDYETGGYSPKLIKLTDVEEVSVAEVNM